MSIGNEFDFIRANGNELWIGATPLAQWTDSVATSTVTVTTAALATDTVLILSVLPVKVYKDYKFKIGAVDVIVTADTEISAGPVNLPVKLSGQIAANATGQIQHVVPLFSINSIQPSTSSTTTSTRNFGSSNNDVKTAQMNSSTYQMSGFEVKKDPGITVLKAIQSTLSWGYFKQVRPDGLVRTFKAVVSQISGGEQEDQDMTFTCNLDVADGFVEVAPT
jgi:hypothetical protein